MVVQEKEGGRWAPLDGAMASAMLAVFNGMTLDALHNTLLGEGESPAISASPDCGAATPGTIMSEKYATFQIMR